MRESGEAEVTKKEELPKKEDMKPVYYSILQEPERLPTPKTACYTTVKEAYANTWFTSPINNSLVIKTTVLEKYEDASFYATNKGSWPCGSAITSSTG